MKVSCLGKNNSFQYYISNRALFIEMYHNNLDEPEVLEVLSRMPALHVLNLMGNPIVRKTIDYR